MKASAPVRDTLDTNEIGAALKRGNSFRKLMEKGICTAYVAETSQTLDGLWTDGEIDLMTLKDVKHRFNPRGVDEYVNAGVSFLLCPRAGLPRPVDFANALGGAAEYTLAHKSNEHSYTQSERQNRYFEALRFIEDTLLSGR